METELDYELEYEPVYADDDAFRLTRNQTVINRTLFGASGYVYGEYEEPQFEVIDIPQHVVTEGWTVLSYADDVYNPIKKRIKKTSKDADNIPMLASDELDEHLRQFSVRR